MKCHKKVELPFFSVVFEELSVSKGLGILSLLSSSVIFGNFGSLLSII